MGVTDHMTWKPKKIQGRKKKKQKNPKAKKTTHQSQHQNAINKIHTGQSA